MEKRAILAAVLMAGLLMVYQFLFVKPAEQPPPSQKAPAPTQTKDAGNPAGSAPAPKAPPTPAEAVPPKEAPAVPERTAVVTAPLYRAQVSSQGGRLDAWDLDYRGVKPMVVKGQFGPKGLEVIRPAGAAAIVAFNLSPESLALGSTGSKGELKLTGEDGYG